MLYLIQLSLHYCLSQLIFFILSSQRVYWCVLDGADCNRQFVKMHFNDKNPAKQNLQPQTSTLVVTKLVFNSRVSRLMWPRAVRNL